MLGNLISAMPKSLMQRIAESLLIVGTASTVYWQPLAQQVPAKLSDIVFVLAVGAWALSLARGMSASTPNRVNTEMILPPVALVASLFLATLVGYLRYDLTMSREGAIVLGRLILCVMLFLATYRFIRGSTRFQAAVSMALLAPAALLALMLVPAVSASMWEQGRFRGLTVNANTAGLGLTIALAMASALAMHEAATRRRFLAGAFAFIAVGMLGLIVWTQSRAYLAGALASVAMTTLLISAHPRLPGLKAAVAAALACLVVAAAALLLVPRAIVSSYFGRISEVALALSGSRAQTADSQGQSHSTRPIAPAGPRSPALSNWILIRGRPSFVPGQTGMLGDLKTMPDGAARRLLENPHVQAALLYAGLVPANPLGYGVNYEEKFFVYFPWINNKHHGTNSILDIPIYGGIGAVLSVGGLMLIVVRRTQELRRKGRHDTCPYRIGATAAFGGLWVAAVLLGSPIFDYQFWIITALALAEPQTRAPRSAEEPGWGSRYLRSSRSVAAR